MKPVIYSCRFGGRDFHNQRAPHLALAMQAGFRRHGIDAPIETNWTGNVVGDLALAYGWIHAPVFAGYKAAGARFLYWDLGYFNRRPGGNKVDAREGHHRFGVDSWDTADTMARGCSPDRFQALDIDVMPTPPRDASGCPAGAVLIAGMSGKAAGTHGFAPMQWENETMNFIRRHTPDNREIIYRAKPKGTTRVEPIEDVLKRTAFIVTHHSNVAVDGLVAGVSCHAKKGIGKLVSYAELLAGMSLMAPVLTIEERRALLADVAYAQWTPEEMRTGVAWDHIKGVLDDA